jgi:uncharacterized protein
MLLEFSVGNFLSIKETKTLSLEAASITDRQENVIQTSSVDLLKSAIIYGPNSSGKSNLVKAMSGMRKLVLSSVEKTSVSTLNVTPFLLSTETASAPSFFEVVFFLDNTRFRYGFEADKNIIHGEWLFKQENQEEELLFIREGDGIDVTDNFQEGKNLEEKTRDNALFLSVADQFNGKIARKIISWFDNQFITISGLDHEDYEEVTFEMLKNDDNKIKLIDFYKKLDLGFHNIIIKKAFNVQDSSISFNNAMKYLFTDLEDRDKLVSIKTLHNIYDNQGKIVDSKTFDMRRQESAGTNKIFNISGAIFTVLNNGGTIIIDELDSSMHPLLTLAITRLFNSKEHNPKNAQLIFTTHDTNLLSYAQYRRDQVYFTEKDQFEATDLYSLVEYKETETEQPQYESEYIKGRYGAIPYLGEFSNLAKHGEKN